ncbi:MAG: hypothetical protein JXB43_05945 [Dehalococcoidia bacterium]|nr:hypothetical protein [Dehalococcoidia bacterium]
MSYLETVIKVGDWLENKNYTGPDVSSPKSQVCSSTLAFSLRGWLNLYHHTKDDGFLTKAIQCADWILALQEPDGSWPFPWPFRRNPANHAFACETMFTAIGLLELYLVTKDKKYLGSISRAKQFILTANGYYKVAEDSYCLWYSSTDKVRIPNLGGIAGHLFSKLFQVTEDPEDLRLATTFANYCISARRSDGSSLYWFPPPDSSLQSGEDYSYDLQGRGSQPLDLHRFCYIPYHSLTIFEVEEVYKFIRTEPYQQYFTEAAQFLSSIMSEYGSVPEMTTRKEWEQGSSSSTKKLYSPLKLPRVAYMTVRSKLFGQGGKLCTAKNIAWTAKAFLAASQHQPAFLPLAEKARSLLVHKSVDDDGGVMYNLYSKNRTLERDKFIRGTSIAFESLSYFLIADKLPD